MRKRITSVLLTLVMLLSLVPAMGTTAAAVSESHPKAANGLKEGGEMCLFWGNGSSIVQYILKDYSASGSSAEEKWNTFKTAYPLNSSQTVNSADGKKKEVKGLAYYDPASGTLYLLGQIGSDCDFEATTDCSDVLTVIVDGDTTLRRGWCGKDHKGLGKMNIEFCNNATLNIPEPGKDMYLYPKAAALDITWTKETSRSDHDPDVKQYGDLELRGTGKLNIVSTIKHSYSEMRYGIQARNITIKDNVSLNIGLQRGTSFSSGILCWSLNIDTTGTVNIDVSNPRDDDVTAIRSVYLKTEAKNYGFNLVNAQSVTLKTQKNAWVLGNGKLRSGGATGIFNSMCKDLEDNKGWTVTKDPSDAVPYTVTMTRAGLSDAVLNVGSQEIPLTGAVTKGDLQVDGNKQALTIKVKVPAWLTTLYKADRVGYDFTASVYENGTEIFKKVNFNLTTPDSSDGTSTVTLTLTGDFMPTAAGKNYIVTFSITPKVKATGEKLESAAINGNWLLTAVEKKTEITSVKLTGDALTEGAASGPNLTSSDTSYTFTQSAWNPSGSIAAGKEYYTTLTLTAKEGYVFPTDWTQLRNSISVKLGDKTITNLGLGLANGGKMLSLTVYATADHNHIWGDWEKDEDGHYRKCSTCNTVSDKEAHNWGNWMNSDEDTEKRTCGTCGYEETRAKPERPISFLKINIIRPVDGATPAASDLTIRDAYVDQVEIVANSVGWYDESGNPVTGAFEKGKSYTIKANFTPKGERTFADTITTAGLFFTLGETKTLSADKKTVDYSCTFTAYESVTVDTALPTLVIGEAMPLPTVADGRTYTVFVMYNAGGLASLSYDSTENKWTDSSNTEVTGDNLKVKADTMYYYSCTIKQGENEKVTAHLTGTGNSTNPSAAGNSVSANYDTTAMNKIASVDLTVDAPVYGESPATNATVPTGANYNAGTPEWSPAVTDGKFGTGEYTVTIPVTAADGYTFAEGCVYTVNGYTAEYDKATSKVSYTFSALTAPHTHDYGAWKKLDDNSHSRTCNAGDDIQVEAHNWGNWKALSGIDEHERTCTACGAKQTEKHNWTVESVENATFESEGTIYYKCSGCGAGKSSSIAKLVKIDVANLTVAKPVKGAAAAEATTTDTAYYVAATEWVAADGTVLDITNGDKFQPGTVYTVKVELEVSGSNRFTDQTVFTINGQPATVVSGTEPTAAGTEYVILTYEFPATGTGSSSSGSGTGSTTYTVKVLDSKNGDVTSSHKTAAKGTTVTLTVSPDKGYALDDLTVLDKNGKEIKLTEKNGKYTFAMPASNVEVEATFKAVKSGDPFVDVPSGAYYEDAVIWAVEEGVTGGTSATTFNPNGICTRAQAVTFLWRAAGSPAPKSTTMPFTDVPTGSYYEQAVLWAVENGITKGTGDTTFSPNATCSRAQIVTFLWRSQKSPAAGSVNPFTDVKSDAYYADAVLWAVKESVTSGTTATTFSPNADCTRAQIVTFIYRALAE